ncbi:MAG: histidine phosphatase family protein [Pyrinomonadaceae bacterium]|nr:histidine phosphatase family protein [Pyrinomonadaceae bacterium]
MLKNRLWANPFVVFLVAAGLVSGVIAVWYFLGDHPVTTVILVRHAEKNIEPDNPNPALSPAGQERALALVHTLGSSGIAAIYATQYIRTQSTATPLANHQGLTVNQIDSRDVAELVRRIKTNNAGSVVFAAGHNNSVPAIIAALGGETFPVIPENEYDNMFIVTVQRFRTTRVLRLKYGNPSAPAVNQQALNQ